MKKSLSFLLALVLCCILAACGGQDVADSGVPAAHTTSKPAAEPPTSPQETPDTSVPVESPDTSEPENEAAGGNGTLLVYFTYGENAPLADGVDASTSASIQYRRDELTGNTGLVADMIANTTGGDLFSILTAEQYPDNYNDTIDVGQTEKSANARPELTSHIDSLDSYDTIFLGFPQLVGRYAYGGLHFPGRV